ncbi:GH3 auxin-responsive promoter family protein, partial [Streptomyces exfoliatus]
MDKQHWQEHWQERRAPFAEECRQARQDLLADLKDPRTAQRRVLADVIDMSAGSVHWREHGYDVVAADHDRFRSVLPVMRYEDFVPEVERETRTKGGILTCSPVMRWLKTSGTTGTPKRVPYT